MKSAPSPIPEGSLYCHAKETIDVIIFIPMSVNKVHVTAELRSHRPKLHIVAQSLYRFIVTGSQKPDNECAWSDLQDTIAVFNAYCGIENADFFASRYPDAVVRMVDENSPRGYSD